MTPEDIEKARSSLRIIKNLSSEIEGGYECYLEEFFSIPGKKHLEEFKIQLSQLFQLFGIEE